MTRRIVKKAAKKVVKKKTPRKAEPVYRVAMLNCRVKPEENKYLKKMAAKYTDNGTVSTLIRKALGVFLEEHGEKALSVRARG